MIGKAIQALIFIMAVIVIGVAVYAAEDKFGDDNFLTSSINAVFDKVSKVTSGEQGILIKDYDKEESRTDYSRDALGRKIQEPTIRTTTKGLPAKDAPATPAEEKL
jgi:maltodextrin utilization protein YvdJ